ncbi:hypothetical protein [Noviluteimonas gilva]|uniref:Uncharacterized protein n=1 Tax=Noviluteimonas gilva TaxID=2682097 RepID=A0A7C9M3Q7_9GAMM|nr:hypothetical protein [Lysobacter gilvus]MUV14606.1 hypothetical protein [Lysobacter gilvus]
MTSARKPRSRLTNIVIAAIVLVLAIQGVGYGLAWSAKTRCADALYAEVTAHNVSGLTPRGDRVLPTRDAVQAQVTGPFEVTVWLAMPRDLHATIYTKRFVVWPWGLRARKTEVLYPV